MEDEDELKAPKVQISHVIAKNPQIKLAENTYTTDETTYKQSTSYKDSASQKGSISPDIDSSSRTRLVEFTEQTDAEIDGHSMQAVGAESKVKVDTRWFSGVIVSFTTKSGIFCLMLIDLATNYAGPNKEYSDKC